MTDKHTTAPRRRTAATKSPSAATTPRLLGATTITLAGKSYEVVPTFKTLVLLEEATGMGVYHFVNHLRDLRFAGLDKAVAALTGLPLEVVEKQIEKTHAITLLQQVSAFCLDALQVTSTDPSSTTKADDLGEI